MNLGRVTVPLATLKQGDVIDAWYKLNAVAHKRELKGTEIGTIRLKARYMVNDVAHCGWPLFFVLCIILICTLLLKWHLLLVYSSKWLECFAA